MSIKQEDLPNFLTCACCFLRERGEQAKPTPTGRAGEPPCSSSMGQAETLPLASPMLLALQLLTGWSPEAKRDSNRQSHQGKHSPGILGRWLVGGAGS